MQTILITGANGNLGLEIVNTLNQKGYGICAAVGGGNLPDDFMQKTLDHRSVNLTDEVETGQYVKNITQQFPGLNAAVLLVGGFVAGGIKDTDSAAIDKQIALNFKTSYFIVRPLLEHFEKNGGGQFILIGARPALQAEAAKNLVAYSLSKSLVFHLAEIINATGKGKGITASVIVPSTIDTAANRNAMPDADFSKWVKAGDIAETIAFLLSEPGKNLRESVLKIYNEA